MIDVSFNNILGSSLGIYMKVKPSLPAAREKTQEVEVPGRDGNLLIRKGVYEQTEISVEFNYIGPESLWGKKWREAKRWLSASNCELRFSDDTEVFYRVSHVNISENTKLGNRVGVFQAVFVTQDGLSYLDSGKREYDIMEGIFNLGILAKPIYKLTGEGICILKVNGIEASVNVSNNIIIDTERMIAYRTDGKSQNTALSGNYEDLYLQSGENSIVVTDGFACKVIPNWRCL